MSEAFCPWGTTQYYKFPGFLMPLLPFGYLSQAPGGRSGPSTAIEQTKQGHPDIAQPKRRFAWSHYPAHDPKGCHCTCQMKSSLAARKQARVRLRISQTIAHEIPIAK